MIRQCLTLATNLTVVGLLFSPVLQAQQLVKDDLITSSNHSSPWQTCGAGSVAIDVTSLDAGGCAYRTTPVMPDTTYTMTCGIHVVKYASITLAFLDAADNTLATDSVEVTEHQSGAWSVTLAAPPATTTAAIGIYGETGSGFQDCTLLDSTPKPEPTKGSISGITWFDNNNNTQIDDTEALINGTNVLLYFNGAVVGQTSTKTDGSYYFGNLDIDSCYTVKFAAADSTLQLGTSGGDNDAGPDGTTGEFCPTSSVPNVHDVDAGFIAIPPMEPPADYAICGVAWLDANGNGTFDGTDSTLPNVGLRLIDTDKGVLDTIRTDDNGNYVFGSLTQGSYNVEFFTPDGHEITSSTATVATAGMSFINDDGLTPRIILPADGNTSESSACTIQHVNGGFTKLEVALEPTVAIDDSTSARVGPDAWGYSVAINDAPCNGEVKEVDLLGHNVPGDVWINAGNTVIVANTTAAGTYSIEYGLRGTCGSYDTATLTVVLVDPAPPPPPVTSGPGPVCATTTLGRSTGTSQAFSRSLTGFAPQYKLYGASRNYMATVTSASFTKRNYTPYNTPEASNPLVAPFLGMHGMRWNGIAYGFDQTAVYYMSSVINGIESALSTCLRAAVSPIALDLENKGRIERILGDFEVDLIVDGTPEALSQWFAPSAGILVREGATGKITGDFLFGNVPGVYADGYAKLATLDKNSDGQVSDDELKGLAIWRDLNSDTIVDDGEMSALSDHQIVSLDVNHYKFMARATKADGKSMLMEDVWLWMSAMASLTK